MSKDAEVRNRTLDRRREGDFAEKVGRGLRTAADLMLRSGRASAPATPSAPVSTANGAWDVERLASQISASAARLLGEKTVDPEADFFQLGGTSVHAVELIAALARDFGVELPLDDLFADARPRRLAERWLRKSAAPAASPEPAPVTRSFHAQPPALDPAQIEQDLQAMQADIELANALPWVAAPVFAAPRRILLTGASGFLGAHVLFDLLRQSDAHVVCLVRADDDAHAKRRLAAELELRDLPWSSELERRISVVAGDIQKQQLGWDAERWAALANDVDSIVNVAAEVDFLRGYSSLRKSNVLGPLTLATFATSGRVKPLHHISTVSIFDEIGIRSMGEDDPVAHAQCLSAGYEKSKWAAEAALRRARERGLVVTFLRPGGIGGHTQTGVYNPQDLSTGFVAAWQALRALPEFRYMNVAPVDWVSRISAEIVLDPAAWGYNYHLVGKPLSLRDVQRDLALGGMNISVVSFDEWRDRFLTRMETNPIPHLEFLTRVLHSAAALKLIEATLTAPAATAARTEAFVRRRGLPKAAPYDAKAQLATFERLARDGRLKLPQREDVPYLKFDETMEGALGLVGSAADVTCSAKFTLSIASSYQIFKERRIDIHGAVSCALLHAEPLSVESGDCWVRPDDGVPEDHGLAHPLLRYRLVLRAADGQRFWFEGKKTARPGRDQWRQGRTLEVELGRLEEPAKFAGVLVVPAASYLPDQVDGIAVNPALPPAEQRIAKLLWLAWFGAQFGLGFLDPLLRTLAELLDRRSNWIPTEEQR